MIDVSRAIAFATDQAIRKRCDIRLVTEYVTCSRTHRAIGLVTEQAIRDVFFQASRKAQRQAAELDTVLANATYAAHKRLR